MFSVFFSVWQCFKNSVNRKTSLHFRKMVNIFFLRQHFPSTRRSSFQIPLLLVNTTPWHTPENPPPPPPPNQAHTRATLCKCSPLPSSTQHRHMHPLLVATRIYSLFRKMILQFQWEPNNNKCFQGDSQTPILFSAKNVLHQKLFYIETGPKNSKKKKRNF